MEDLSTSLSLLFRWSNKLLMNRIRILEDGSIAGWSGFVWTESLAPFRVRGVYSIRTMILFPVISLEVDFIYPFSTDIVYFTLFSIFILISNHFLKALSSPYHYFFSFGIFSPVPSDVDPDPVGTAFIWVPGSGSGSRGIKWRKSKNLSSIFFLFRKTRNRNALPIIQKIKFLIFKSTFFWCGLIFKV